MGDDLPREDPVAEARRLVELGAATRLVVRAVGGAAFTLQARQGLHLPRAIKDVDVVVPKGASRSSAELMTRAGYLADGMFNALHGASRLLFCDQGNGRHLDVFVGAFSLCHAIPIAERLDRDPLTVPREELLLTKLQIVQLTENDRIDIVNLLADYDVVDGEDAEAIDGGFIARLCARDWGLWRTTTGTLNRVTDYVPGTPLDAEIQAIVLERARRLLGMLDAAPKSTKWKIRSKVGDRVKWHDEPTEEA